MTTNTTTQNDKIIVRIATRYNDRDTISHRPELSIDEIDEANATACCANGEAGVRYEIAEVLDDDLCYQTWIDSVANWDGCPDPSGAEESYEANCEWAEDQARNKGIWITTNNVTGRAMLLEIA